MTERLGLGWAYSAAKARGENIVSAPKPEMLEKARRLVYSILSEHGVIVATYERALSFLEKTCADQVQRVALALEKAVRARDEEWKAKALETIGKLVASEEALRASEASLLASKKETQNALNGWTKANDRIRAQMVALDKAEASVERLWKRTEDLEKIIIRLQGGRA